MRWISVEEALPEDGKYVLIHLTKDNWHDSTDNFGVYCKVAKICRGISKEDREKMKRGEMEDEESIGWTYPNDIPTKNVSKRSSVYMIGDESDNNHKPYSWKEFGICSFWGQEVDYWMPIPELR